MGILMKKAFEGISHCLVTALVLIFVKIGSAGLFHFEVQKYRDMLAADVNVDPCGRTIMAIPTLNFNYIPVSYNL